MKIKYQNKQLYSECRLVSLWNAARYYGIDVPIMGSDQYNNICEECCCIVGACINIDNERARLCLNKLIGKKDFNWIKNNIPVQIPIFHPKVGFHSILVVAVKKDKLLITNYTKNRLQWLRWKTIKSMIPKAPNNEIYSYIIRKSNGINNQIL